LTEKFFKHGFEVLIKLVKIYAALPTTNSEIERIQLLKRIKTDLKNKLSVGRIQKPIMISLNEEDIKE